MSTGVSEYCHGLDSQPPIGKPILLFVNDSWSKPQYEVITVIYDGNDFHFKRLGNTVKERKYFKIKGWLPMPEVWDYSSIIESMDCK